MSHPDASVLLGRPPQPALTFADALEDGTPWRDVPRYVLDIETLVVSQLLGAALAVCLFRLLQRPAAPASAQAGPWTVICVSSREGVAELAVGLINGLAAPARVHAIASSVDEPAPTNRAEATLVLRLVSAGTSPEAALLGEVWQLPASELQAALRARLQRFLRECGWLRLYSVGGTPAPSVHHVSIGPRQH